MYRANVEAIQFLVGTDETNVSQAYAQILDSKQFEADKPVPGGLYDSHLGTCVNEYNCTTCFNNRASRACPGHDGFYELNYPVTNPLFLPSIIKWLRAICHSCGQFVLTINKVKEIMGEAPDAVDLDETAPDDNLEDGLYTIGLNLTIIYKTAKGSKGKVVKCENCESINPHLLMGPENITISAEEYSPNSESNKPVKTWEIYPHDMLRIFQLFPNELLVDIGLSTNVHPRNLILNVIKIPPATVRPSVSSQAKKNANQITAILSFIIEINNNISEDAKKITKYEDFKKLPDKEIKNIRSLIARFHAFINSPSQPDVSNDGTTSSMNINDDNSSSMIGDIKSKKGIIRGYLCGKRANFLFRTVIVCDISLPLNYVRIPLEYAMTLTIAVVVRDYNKEKCMQFFLNGVDTYPGCNYIKKKSTGKQYRVDKNYKEGLDLGDTIYRHLVDDDICWINRQPSLWKPSVSCMRIKVATVPGVLTMGLNVSSCVPFNADFDGDQMNGSIPNSRLAQTEGKFLTMIDRNMLFEKSSAPLFGQVQDAVLACALFTRDSVRISKKNAIRLLSRAGILPKLDKKVYTGREIIELLIPPINFKRTASFYSKDYAPYTNYNPRDTQVVIKNGKILSGVLDGASIKQGKKDGIYHIIALDYGFERAFRCIYEMQQVVIEYLKSEGFTIDATDYLHGEETDMLLKVLQDSLIRKAKDFTDRLNSGSLIPPIGMTVSRYYEESLLNILKPGDDPLIPILKTVDPQKNRFFLMSGYGSKGSARNLYNITAFIGMLNINNRWIPDTFSYKRTTPWDVRCPEEPEARGYIRNCYVSTLNSREQYCNAVKSRFDIITKGLMTSETGYKNREGFKSCESLHTTNKNVVCIENNLIVQFMYGDHGINLKYMETTKLPTVMISDSQLELDFHYRAPQKYKSLQKLFDVQFDRIKQDRETYRDIFMKIEAMNYNMFIKDTVQLPVNPERVVENVKYSHEKKISPGLSEFERMLKKVDKFISGSSRWFFYDEFPEEKIPIYAKSATTLFQMALRIHLRPEILAEINEGMLDQIFEMIKIKFSIAIIDGGSAIGTLASQCISEPMTQFMLDSHHMAGSSKDEDIRNFEAIIRVFPPSDIGDRAKMRIILKDLNEPRTKEEIQKIANTMEELQLDRFVSSYHGIYEGTSLFEPKGKFKDDKKFIDRWFKNNPLQKPKTLLNWSVRFTMDLFTIIQKNATIEDIVVGLKKNHPDLFIIWNSENENPFIRIYMSPRQFPKVNVVEAIHVEKFIENTILPTMVRGIDGIREAKTVKIHRSKIDKNGEIVRDENAYGIRTKGINLYDVMLHKDVDRNKTQCNNVYEIARFFGTEAARQHIVIELRNILKSENIETTHYMVYSDMMSSSGVLTKISSAGIKSREYSNILLRMSMANAPLAMVEGALGNIVNKIEGVSSPQIMGQIPKRGTTYNRFVVNEEFVKKNLSSSIKNIIDDL